MDYDAPLATKFSLAEKNDTYRGTHLVNLITVCHPSLLEERMILAIAFFSCQIGTILVALGTIIYASSEIHERLSENQERSKEA
jgi:hypothetical protein